MSARPIRMRLCDAIHDQFNGEIEPLQRILGIPENDFEPFLRGMARLDDQHFERAVRWLFDYEGRVKPATPYANKVMAPTCEPEKMPFPEVNYVPVERDEPIRKSTEDLCQWIVQLEDQVKILSGVVNRLEKGLVTMSERFARIRDAVE